MCKVTSFPDNKQKKTRLFLKKEGTFFFFKHKIQEDCHVQRAISKKKRNFVHPN